MTKPRIIYTRHAQTMMTERGIKEEWITKTIAEPETAELDPGSSMPRLAIRSVW